MKGQADPSQSLSKTKSNLSSSSTKMRMKTTNSNPYLYDAREPTRKSRANLARSSSSYQARGASGGAAGGRCTTPSLEGGPSGLLPQYSKDSMQGTPSQKVEKTISEK